MRFHYGESMTPVENYQPLALAAEKHGYAGFSIPDSLIYPKESNQEYLYTEDGGRTFLENKPFVETLTMCMAIGAWTKTLELTTNVFKLPVRQPLYSAKIVSSIAALTNNRLNFGVGLSVWPEDYVAMGVPFEKRGKRFDECIEIVRGLTNGGYYEFHGEFYDLPAVKLNPIPTKPIPILIGGHSDPALKRAAYHDGFIAAGGDVATVKGYMDKINAHRREAGTEGKPYRVFTTWMGHIEPDQIKQFEDIGVTDLTVAFRNLYAVEADTQPLTEKVDDLRRFADNVIAKHS
jgi:alkanesulfonate monooxygenase SsuD/methylene tetrahydromethanopterin reductase-like flavin-dependent oxidoreductase (luciferase family)